MTSLRFCALIGCSLTDPSCSWTSRQFPLRVWEMKVSELLLLVSCVLSVSADGELLMIREPVRTIGWSTWFSSFSSGQHEDLYISGCSDSKGEDLYTLEGEEIWYADFIKKTGVEPQPSFIDHMTCPGCYDGAVANQQICRSNLKNSRIGMKDLPVEFGKDKYLLF